MLATLSWRAADRLLGVRPIVEPPLPLVLRADALDGLNVVQDALLEERLQREPLLHVTLRLGVLPIKA